MILLPNRGIKEYLKNRVIEQKPKLFIEEGMLALEKILLEKYIKQNKAYINLYQYS